LKENSANDTEQISALLWGYFASGQRSQAIEIIDQLKEDVDYPSSRVSQALVDCAEARLHIGVGLYDDARSQAHSCFEKLVTSDVSLNRSLAADAAHIIGLTYHEAGSYSEALKWYGRSRSLRPTSAWNFEIGLAATLNNIGNVLWKQGKLIEALVKHREALAVKISALDSSHIDVAASYNNIGVVYAELRDHETALDYHRKALSIREMVNPTSRPMAHSYHNIAQSLFRIGKLDEALGYVLLAITIKESLLPSDHYDLVSSQKLQALILSQLGRFGESDKIFRRLNIQCSENPQPICDEVYSDFMTHVARRNTSATSPFDPVDLYNTALQSRFLTPDKILSLVLALVEAETVTSTWSKHCRNLEEAIAIRWKIGGNEIGGKIDASNTFERPVHLAHSLGVLSTCYVNENLSNGESQSDIIKILSLARASLEILEYSVATELPLTPPQELNSIIRAVSLNGIWARYKLGPEFLPAYFEEDLLLFSDYATNWSFQSAVNDLRALRRAGASEEEVELLRRSLLSFFQPSHLGFPTQSQHTNAIKLQDRRTRSSLIDKYPLFSIFRPRHRTYDLERLKLNLEQSGSTAILFEHINDSAFAIVFESEQIRLINLGPVQLSDSLVTNIGNLRRIENKSDLELLNLGYSFYIEPIDLNSERITLVRNTITSRLPFEAFVPVPPTPHDRRVRYLIDDLLFSHALTLSEISPRSSYRSQDISNNRLFAVYPKFGDDDNYSDELREFLLATGIDISENKLSPLPGAQREIDSITSLFKKFPLLPNKLNTNTVIRTTLESVEAELKKVSAKRYDFLHFATHSFAHTSNPSGTGIVLETVGKNGEDGILFVEEVYSLNLDASLVVLSSCESAATSSASNNGLTGFAKGFIYAGANNLVASMWQSDDVATMVMMQSFYSHLGENRTIEEALRLAKLDLINMGGPIANPYYWAGFIHIGAPSGINVPEA